MTIIDEGCVCVGSVTSMTPVPMWSGLGRSWSSPHVTMKHQDDGAYLMQPLWSWTDDHEDAPETDRSGKETVNEEKKEFVPFNR